MPLGLQSMTVPLGTLVELGSVQAAWRWAAARSVADAVAAFMADPKSLTITVDSKAGPIKFSRLGDIKSLEDLLSLVDVKATSGP